MTPRPSVYHAPDYSRGRGGGVTEPAPPPMFPSHDGRASQTFNEQTPEKKEREAPFTCAGGRGRSWLRGTGTAAPPVETNPSIVGHCRALLHQTGRRGCGGITRSLRYRNMRWKRLLKRCNVQHFFTLMHHCQINCDTFVYLTCIQMRPLAPPKVFVVCRETSPH